MDKSRIWKIVSYCLFGLIILGIIGGGYFWWRPRVANDLVVKSTTVFLEGRDNDDVSKYTEALNLLDRAIAWGKYDSTIGLYRTQLLAGLDRFEEARQQLEKIRATDPSAKQAVEDLLSQLPQ